MDKYTLLLILTIPFVLYGLFNILLAYKLKRLRPRQALLRLIFWLILLIGIVFAKPIYDLIYERRLTDSPPLSIFDVMLAAGIMLSLSLVTRAHSRAAELENKITELHEKLAIRLSGDNE